MAISNDLSERLSSLNLAEAVERVGGDDELLLDIAGVYLGEYPGLLDEIGQAVEAGDAPRLLHSAHTLKGSLATIGADRAAAVALQLEMMGREAETSGAAEPLTRLRAALEEVHRDLALLIRS
ncbi:MAG: Hpt domain-containing protein [Bryobacteraceae bacterium]